MTKFLILGALTFSIASAQSLLVINPNFRNVPIQCSGGYAYQSAGDGNCDSSFPQQTFNITPSIGWRFEPFSNKQAQSGAGLTNPNTNFDPPPFEGLPFSTAAFLQGPDSAVVQTVDGFVPDVVYRLSFYLGSRYAYIGDNGNQTVQVTIDGIPIATIGLVSSTPFALHTLYFGVATPGPHIVKFAGLATGDETAFFSNVHISAVL